MASPDESQESCDDEFDHSAEVKFQNSLTSLVPKSIDTEQLIYRAGYQDGWREAQAAGNPQSPTDTAGIAWTPRRVVGGSALVGGVVGALAASLVTVLLLQNSNEKVWDSKTAVRSTVPTDERELHPTVDSQLVNLSLVPADETYFLSGTLSTRSHHQSQSQFRPRSFSVERFMPLADPAMSGKRSLPLRHALLQEMEQSS